MDKKGPTHLDLQSTRKDQQPRLRNTPPLVFHEQPHSPCRSYVSCLSIWLSVPLHYLRAHGQAWEVCLHAEKTRTGVTVQDASLLFSGGEEERKKEDLRAPPVATLFENGLGSEGWGGVGEPCGGLLLGLYFVRQRILFVAGIFRAGQSSALSADRDKLQTKTRSSFLLLLAMRGSRASA